MLNREELEDLSIEEIIAEQHIHIEKQDAEISGLNQRIESLATALGESERMRVIDNNKLLATNRRRDVIIDNFSEMNNAMKELQRVVLRIQKDNQASTEL